MKVIIHSEITLGNEAMQTPNEAMQTPNEAIDLVVKGLQTRPTYIDNEFKKSVIDYNGNKVGNISIILEEESKNIEMTLYGTTKMYGFKKLEKHLLDCMMNSEGAEQSRYTDCYTQLCSGEKVISDER